jgi:monofunctional biosynthetic peptidoglycan transglycosylase
LKLNPTGTSKYVEKRAEIVYGIMVRRGVVIEEFEDIMKAPPDGPPQESGAPRPPGQTSGTVEVAEGKDAAKGQTFGTPSETKQAPASALTARDEKGSEQTSPPPGPGK